MPERMIQYDLGSFSEITVHSLSDLHLGENVKLKLFKKWRENILKEPNRFVILNGDMMNIATKSSKSNVYTDKLNPNEQIDELVKELEPIKDRILMVTNGNHESRINRESGVDIVKFVCSDLGIRNLYKPTGGFLKVSFGRRKDNAKQQVYTLYASHVISGSVPALEKFCYSYDSVDCFAFGHTHKPLSRVLSKVVADPRKDIYVLVSGSYVEYFGSYGQEKSLPASPNLMGYFWLSGEERKIEVRL